MKLYGFLLAIFCTAGLVQGSDSSSQALQDRKDALDRLNASAKNKCGEDFRQTNGYKTPPRGHEAQGCKELEQQNSNAPKKIRRS